MAVYNHLLFSEIFFQQVRSETADLDNLRATLSTIRGTWQYYLPPPPDWDGIGWVPSRPFSPDDVAQLRANIVEQIFAYLELTYGPCEADERAFFLYADWTQEDRTGLCLVLPFSANIEGRDPETGIIPKGRNYAQQLMRLLREHDLDWGVLTNGRHWRLFHRTELSPTETYLHVDLERIIAADDIGDYIVFHRFFSRPAFARQDGRQRLDLYKQQSDEATEVIEDHLSAHVEEIARQLCQGLVEGCRVEGDDVTSPQVRTEIYKNALFLVYRLLFVLYAEARDLLPLDVPTYRDVCLRDLLAEVQQNHERGMRYDDEYAMWTRLQALFALIDQGDPAAGVPAYNGGLFDPGRRPFLTEHRIRNDYLQAALIRLSTISTKGKSYDQDRKPQPIDYRDLSVRHLGSLYEGLLEYNLFVVEDESRVVRVTKKKTQYVPYSEAGKVRAGETVLQVGDVYFSETAGERKATGSYYTPEDVVDYIVRNTVGAKLAELKAEFYEAQGIERQLADLNDTPPDIPAHRQIQQALDAQFLDFVRQKVLDLKILDPAMGSGHFLVNATHAVADFVVEVLNETPWENGEFDTNVATWKRQVAERCIFGVDLNELAVELAKLCLWMTTAAKGKPLTFLDHHLRWGNSLVGAWLKDVGVYPGTKKESQQAFTLPLERFEVDLDQVLAAYQELYAKSSDDVDDVREKARIFDEEIYPSLERYRELLDLHTTAYIGNDLEEETYTRLGRVVHDPVSWVGTKTQRVGDLLSDCADQHWFHWELEYPEALTQGRSGFDVTLGNPPYLEVNSISYPPSLPTLQECGNTFVGFVEVGTLCGCAGSRFGFILPLSAISTTRMQPFQNLLKDRATETRIANFSWRPGRIFEEVHLPVSIVTGKVGIGDARIYTTRYNLWRTEERSALFDSFSFVEATNYLIPGSIPKLGAVIEHSILNKMYLVSAELGDFVDRGSDNIVFYRRGGLYFKVFVTFPTGSSEEKRLPLRSDVPKHAVTALLSSSLWFWFFTVYSDCRHLGNRDIYTMPVNFDTMPAEIKSRLTVLGERLVDDLESKAERTVRVYKGSKRVPCIQFNVKDSMELIDQIDQVLAHYYGFSEAELNHILGYNREFRLYDN
jgi:hypothetical protein